MGMGNLTRPFRSSRKRLAATALTVVALFSVAVTAVALALLDGGYAINGSVPDAGTTFFPDPVGSVKELGPANGSDTKVDVIHDADPPMLGFTDVNGGLDLSGMWLDTTVDPENGDVWLYFAWQREEATTGFIAFEFQQSKQPVLCNYAGNLNQVETNPLNAATTAFIANCNPWANRADGDFMVLWDLQGNSTDLYTRDFDGTDFGAPGLIADANANAAFGPNLLTGEAAINLTASGILPSGSNATECVTFANVIAATVTGNSNTADFKDTILADTSGVGISNCGSVKVQKATIPAGGTGEFDYELSRTSGDPMRYVADGGETQIDGTLTAHGDSDTILDLKIGTDYTLDEVDLAPEWQLSSIVCQKAGSQTTYSVFPGDVDFPVEASTLTTCTITNTKKPRLTVTKVVVGGDGTSFDVKVNTDTVLNNTTGGTAGPTVYPVGTNYTVTEFLSDGVTPVPAADWDIQFSGDCSGTLNAGGDKSCTITNTKRPKLKVIKTVVNDNGGTAVAGDFNLHVKLGGVDVAGSPAAGVAGPTGRTYTLAAGTYVVSEDALPAGYSQTGIVCDGQATASVTLAAGQNKTCEITNNDNAPSLTLNKIVVNDNGGTALESAWTLTADGPTPLSGPGAAGSADVVSGASFDQGTYNLSESAGPGGYTASTWSCVKNAGAPVVGASVAVGLGDTVVCTITNNDNAPSLTLNKIVVNDNGGTALESAWTLTADGPTPLSGPGAAGSADVVSGASFDQGTYNLSESAGPGGYTASTWSCVKNAGAPVVGASVAVGLGDTVVCTITNNDNAPSLTLNKIVVNDNGGTALESAWTLTADGPTPLSGPGAAGSADVVSGASFDQGTYNLSESAGPGGYTASTWSCVKNAGAPVVGASVAVGLGDTVVCTITNNDNAPSLTLNKIVVNDNGGTALESAWTLTADGPTPLSGPGAAGSADVVSGASFDQGTYNLSESAGPGGYTASTWSCVKNAGAPVVGASVAVGLGDTVVCTITNNDNAPSLTLNKIVVNDNGGTALESAWTLTADGPTPLSGPGAAGSADVVSGASFDQGTYNLSESAGPGGYTASTWSCVKNAGAPVVGASVAVGLGDTVVCTITNNDNAPSLTLNKIVVNDNGGTALESAWTLTADGPTPLSGPGAPGSADVVSGASFDKGTYTLSETGGPSSYAASSWECTGTGTQGVGADSNKITVELGQSAVCTITNNDKAPRLHLRKVLVNDNGGQAQITSFTLTADGTGSNDLSGTSPVDSTGTLDADTWALSETNVPGYSASAWVCVGGDQVGATITLLIDQEATCTITNNDIPPGLTLNKVVVNDNGGTAPESAWTLSAAGPTPFSGPGAAGPDDVVSNPNTFTIGTYTLSESAGPAGYTASDWVCTGTGTQGTGADKNKITIGLGQSAHCTITNDDIAPKLHLRKIVVNNNGGTATVANFPLLANGTGANDLSGTSPVDSGTGLDADTWALSETPLAGYAASSWVCVGDGEQDGSSITLGLADEATCTITNDDIAPKLHLRKVVVNNNGGTATVANFPLTANGAGANDLSGISPVDSTGTLLADTWALSETSPAGYTASDWVCVGGNQNGANITVGIGGEATCTITNNDIAPKLHLRKVVVNNNGGTATVANFTLTANGSGSNDLSGISPVDSNGTLLADTWVLSETNVPGYSNEGWDCVGGAQGGTSITVGIGGEATCTITNDDIAPKLHLRKVVVNNNGGTATVANFPLLANGAGSNDLSGTSPVDSTGTLLADTWALSETPFAGYAASAWVCVGGEQDGSSITVDIGGEATCTITNDDIAPKLTLIKKVVGSDEPVTSWTLTADGTDANDVTGTSPVVSGATLAAGTFALSEVGPAGYDASPWTCEGTGKTLEGASLTLALAADVTCEITNSKRPLVKVIKNLEPEEDEGRFDLLISGYDPFTNGGAGFGDGGTTDFQDVDPGQVVVGEAGHGATKLSSYFLSVDCGPKGGSETDSEYEFEVAYGDEVTCVITNKRRPSSIDVTKTPSPSSKPEPGGTFTYTVTVENTSDADEVTLNAASFVERVAKNTPALETSPVVAITDLDCNGDAPEGEPDNGDGLPITLAIDGPDSMITCTFTGENTGNAGDVFNDRITVTGKDEANRDVEAYAEATVNLTNVPASITIMKTATPTTVNEPGGLVTFHFLITNTSTVDSVTIDTLVDTIYGNLAVKPTCDGVIGDVLAPSGTTECSFQAMVTGNAGSVHHNMVTVTGHSNDGADGTLTATDDATVTVTDVLPEITVEKTANPTHVFENTVGALVTYTVTVTNDSVEPVTLTSLDDDVFGNLGNPNNVKVTNNTCVLPQDLEKAGGEDDSYTCTFDALLKGSSSGDPHINTVTGTAHDDEDNEATDEDDATVVFDNVPSTITVAKTANPTVVQDSGPVTFTVVVRNDSAVDTVYIQTLTDSIYGNLNPKGTCTLEDNIAEGPAGSRQILPGASYTCSFTATVSKTETDVVTATGVDDDGQAVTDDDDATVTVNITPPPPYVPKADIAVTKAATPQVTLPLGGGTAAITYNLVVTNNGPDAAANVKVADTAPADVSFTSATTSAGSCTTAAKALDCTIASLAPGASVAITINATVSATGTKVNVVVVTTTTPETNSTNNQAQASTVVIAPVTPPKPPVVVPEICETIVVTPKVLKGNGKSQKINIKVTKGKKPVAGATVKITGPGIAKTVKTGKNGKVTVTFKPSKPGIITVAIQGAKACNTQRVGVVGVYEPPVTG